MRASVATWAFDTGNSFDLVALPKLTGLVLDPSDLILAVESVSANCALVRKNPHPDPLPKGEGA